MDFSQLNAAEQIQMSRILEKKQMQDFLKMYSNLVEGCFTACCNDFTSKALSSKDLRRAMSVTLRGFLKHSERVGARFAELNAEQMVAADSK